MNEHIVTRMRTATERVVREKMTNLRRIPPSAIIKCGFHAQRQRNIFILVKSGVMSGGSTQEFPPKQILHGVQS
jgi:hypothetical protein